MAESIYTTVQATPSVRLHAQEPADVSIVYYEVYFFFPS